MKDVIKNLIDRAAKDLVDAKYAIALTGAGISTESGIADFRGPSGIWTRNPEAERQAYESYPKFLRDPRAFWEELISSPPVFLADMEKAAPNRGHRALAELEQLGILKWTITQNIDALHAKAGSKKVLDYHGNLLKLRCPECNQRFEREQFDLEKMFRTKILPPRCTACGSAVKSDVVYFGEPIPADVAEQSFAEAQRCDLMLICGTSAVVYPFANLPRLAAAEMVGDGYFPARRKKRAVVIEVNAQPTPLTHEQVSSYFIQGMTGEILPRIVEAVKALKGS